MSIIPVFTDYSKAELCERFNLSLGQPIQTDVSFLFDDIQYLDETIPEGEAFIGDFVAYNVNSYQADLSDAKTGATFTTILYLDENAEQFVAIQDTAHDENKRYDLTETPFQQIIARESQVDY